MVPLVFNQFDDILGKHAAFWSCSLADDDAK
jgi:hypothetical protein